MRWFEYVNQNIMRKKYPRPEIAPYKILRAIMLLAIGMQLIVISQLYFSDPELMGQPFSLVMRLIRGISLSFVAALILVYPTLHLIGFLNEVFPWKERPVKRFLVQFAVALVGGTLITPVIVLPAIRFFGLDSDFETLKNNLYYMIILHVFLMFLLEALIYFDDSARLKLTTEQLHQELAHEAEKRALMEAKIAAEKEKAEYARRMIEQEKQLNQQLQEAILKRELLSAELHQSREQLQSILTNLAGAAFRCKFDDDYTMIYISEKIFDICGYHAHEFIHERTTEFASIIHPEDRTFCRNAISAALLADSQYDIEYRLLHKNGETVWVHENGKAMRNPENEILHIDGIITDVSRRKEAEQAAIESEQNFKDLMDFIPQPVFELDLKGNVVFGNKAGFAFFGPAPDEPGRYLSALECFIEEDIPRIIESFKRSNEGILTEPSEYTAIKHDGTLCPVLVFGTPIIKNGQITGRRGIIVDISERKRQEMKLLKAYEELEKINNTLEQSVAERTKELTEANTKLLKLQKENLQSQFEVLKQQVNPHFLFNSLNVLTSLIKLDPDLAESFTERLSKVYRYVLENKDKDLVNLSTEMEFLHAYLFLLEIRFMNKIMVEINVEKLWYDHLILPLAIQLIIENAIKHNTFSKSQPLQISVYVDENQHLIIANNLNIRETKPISTGVGLENIIQRYALITEAKPAFSKTNGLFMAQLPLLKPEKITQA